MDKDYRLKRLIYRASHRGTKEADILLGNYAADKAPAMTEAQFAAFETLLEETDRDLVAWITGQSNADGHAHLDLIVDIRNFHIGTDCR